MVAADPAFEQALTEAALPVIEGWINAANAAGIDGQAAFDFYRSQLVGGATN